MAAATNAARPKIVIISEMIQAQPDATNSEILSRFRTQYPDRKLSHSEISEIRAKLRKRGQRKDQSSAIGATRQPSSSGTQTARAVRTETAAGAAQPTPRQAPLSRTSVHVAALKAAAQALGVQTTQNVIDNHLDALLAACNYLGREESKRILDLFTRERS